MLTVPARRPIRPFYIEALVTFVNLARRAES
jgi:hypothetical protein